MRPLHNTSVNKGLSVLISWCSWAIGHCCTCLPVPFKALPSTARWTCRSLGCATNRLGSSPQRLAASLRTHQAASAACTSWLSKRGSRIAVGIGTGHAFPWQLQALTEERFLIPHPVDFSPTGSACRPASPAPAPPTSLLNHSVSHAHIGHPPGVGTLRRAIASAWRPALALPCSPHTM